MVPQIPKGHVKKNVSQMIEMGSIQQSRLKQTIDVKQSPYQT
jgi:hypothetical protein